MDDNVTLGFSLAADSGEYETLTQMLQEIQTQSGTLKDIETATTAQSENIEMLQGQLTECYKLIAFIFLLLICYGVYKFFSGLLNS